MEVIEVAIKSRTVFARRNSTVNEPLSLLICLDATKFVLLSLSFFTLIQKICPTVWAKSLLKNAKSPFPVGLHHSNASFLKLPSVHILRLRLETKMKVNKTIGN